MKKKIRYGGIIASIFFALMIVLACYLFIDDDINSKEYKKYWNESVVRVDGVVTRCEFYGFDKDNKYTYILEAYYVIDGNMYNIYKVLKPGVEIPYVVDEIIDVYVDDTTFINLTGYVEKKMPSWFYVVCIVMMTIGLIYALLYTFHFFNLDD